MNTFPTPIRVVIADDHEIFRQGLHTILNKMGAGQVRIIAEAENGEELLKIVGLHKPDIVLTDIKMPVMDGIEASRQISEKHPGTAIIALSTFDENALIMEMFEAGAKGYLLKNTTTPEMIEAIKAVHCGETYYCSFISRSLVKLIALSRYNPYKKTTHIILSKRELDIVRLICKQRTAKEIAEALEISIRMVEEYGKHIREKMDVRNLVGIALYAVKNNIISVNEI